LELLPLLKQLEMLVHGILTVTQTTVMRTTQSLEALSAQVCTKTVMACMTVKENQHVVLAPKLRLCVKKRRSAKLALTSVITLEERCVTTHSSIQFHRLPARVAQMELVSLFIKHAHLRLNVTLRTNASLTRQTLEHRVANYNLALRVQIVRQISASLDTVLSVMTTSNVVLLP
jgi:hypothetical protein